MKSASAALINYLNSNTSYLMAELYLFTLVGGFQVGYTDKETAFTVGGVTYSPFMIERTKTRVMVGTEVDTLNVTVNAASTDLLNGVPWLQAVRNGALDGANLQVFRLFMPSWGDTSLGAVMLFDGRVADVEVGRSEARLTVKSPLELFDVQLPRNVYQSGCMNTLFDAGCKLAKANYASNGVVQAGSSAAAINTNVAAAEGYFSLGTITFTSGANNGVTRSVRYWNGSGQYAVLALPLLTAPAPGDTFTLYPGCDRMLGTCQSKFNNMPNYRGQPFIPDPETGI